MAEQQPVETYDSSVELGTRLNELEQKQKLMKDRILLVGENLIEFREESVKFESEIKDKLRVLNSEIQDIKRVLNRIINEFPNLARKSELEILNSQLKLFQPLEFARIKDVKNMIEQSQNIKEKETK
jgi:seryl-tRNA synthetase